MEIILFRMAGVLLLFLVVKCDIGLLEKTLTYVCVASYSVMSAL